MEHLLQNRSDASAAAARHIAAALKQRLSSTDEASIVVSGGSSPVECFAALADTDLDWSRTHIILSDERWVESNHEDSNENLLRKHLLINKATEARLLPVYREHMSIREGCEFLDMDLRSIPSPFACALLGMGSDGHFASLFPDADNLDEGLSLESDELCIAVETASSPYARLSLTLNALTRSDGIVLLMFGQEKLDVYRQAKSAASQLPIAHLFRQQRAPVHIYWAP